MGLWAKLFGRKQSRSEPAEENVLVISDIHLGEDVLTEGPEHLSGYIRVLNQRLAEFVSAHATTHLDARRWHLVINGDMFDFVKVSLRPTAEEAYEHWSRNLSDEEMAQLPNTPENMVWKLGRILEIHRPLFKEMARFMLNGHRISIIEGNHDAEFYFPEVQETLREFLVKEATKLAQRHPGDFGDVEPEEVRNRISFRAWFEADGGRYHIEHGNQYDPFCSFEYNLAPLHSAESSIVATPMSHRVMPYFAELLGDFSTHGIDQWGLKKWGTYAFNLGPRMLVVLAKVYAVAMWELISEAGTKRRDQIAALEKEHRKRLWNLTERTPYGISTLERLDGLKATPAEYSMLRMMNLFYVDRFALVLGLGLLLGLGWLVGGAGGWTIGVASTATALILAWALANMRHYSVEETLRGAAARIADLTGARYVVFGHSHHPEMINLRESHDAGRFGENAFYFNSGSWVTREILLGQEGKGMTYVEISSRGAALKRWLGREHPPVVLAATDPGSATPDEHLSAEDAPDLDPTPAVEHTTREVG